MSSLTQCNYCSLKDSERRAAKTGHVITVIGHNVYRHPREVTIRWDSPQSVKDAYFISWMMEIGTHCEC